METSMNETESLVVDAFLHLNPIRHIKFQHAIFKFSYLDINVVFTPR